MKKFIYAAILMLGGLSAVSCSNSSQKTEASDPEDTTVVDSCSCDSTCECDTIEVCGCSETDSVQ